MKFVKHELDPYTITRNDVRLLRELSKEQLTVSGIASRLGITPGFASRIIKGLERKGFVTETRKGSSKEIQFSTNLHAQLFLDLTRRESNVAWEKILANAGLNILMSNAGLIPSASYSRATMWRVKKNLEALGLDGRNDLLHEFLKAYADYISRETASKILPQFASILWRKGSMYFFRLPVGEALKGRFQLTALSVFPRFGIRLITRYDYYFYSPNRMKLTVEDYILHTLLINPSSPTYATYAILLLLKEYKQVDQSKLISKAQEYGISGVVHAIIQYLNTNGTDRSFPLPPYAELKEKAELYGVKIR